MGLQLKLWLDRLDRTSRDVTLNVRYRLGLVALTSRLGIDTLTSQYRLGLGIIRLICNPASTCIVTYGIQQCNKFFYLKR